MHGALFSFFCHYQYEQEGRGKRGGGGVGEEEGGEEEGEGESGRTRRRSTGKHCNSVELQVQIYKNSHTKCVHYDGLVLLGSVIVDDHRYCELRGFFCEFFVFFVEIRERPIGVNQQLCQINT